jgi:rod shape determining protein RodA
VSQALLIITGLLLAALTIAGQALYGSARWFDTGVILIQPSEFAKIVVILVLADFFARNQEKLANILWIGRSLLYALWIMVWILLQPNLSTSLVILVIWFALLWASGLKVKYLAVASVVAIILPFVAYPFLEEYQQDRITNFLFPDPQATHGETTILSKP